MISHKNQELKQYLYIFYQLISLLESIIFCHKIYFKTTKHMNLITIAMHRYKTLKNLKITADCFEWSTRRTAPEKVFQDIFSDMGSTLLPYWLHIKMVPLFCGTYSIYRMTVPRYFVFVLRVCAYPLIYLSCVSSQKQIENE